MVEYFIRRIAIALPTLFLISVMCFFVINMPAGDVVDDYEQRLIANMSYSAASARQEGDRIRALYGLDQPLPVQYVRWAYGFLQGDYGLSLVTFRPVSEMIWERLAYTIGIAALALLTSWSVGLIAGIYSATHQYTKTDYIATLLSFMGLSIPNFLLALALLVFVVFVLRAPMPLGLFSSEYANAPWGWAKIRDLMAHLWIPVLVAGTPGAATVMRIMRANLLDELGSQYVETARAKGLPERSVILKHGVRMAINPLISLLGVQFPRIISAGIITSIVMSLPTIGPVLQNALQTQDIYVSSTILMMLGVLLVVGNLVADVLLAWVDPRIRLH